MSDITFRRQSMQRVTSDDLGSKWLKMTISPIFVFFYFERNFGRFGSDFFLLKTGISEQLVKRSRQEIGETIFFANEKPEILPL